MLSKSILNWCVMSEHMSASRGQGKLFAVAASLLMIVSMLPAGVVGSGAAASNAGNVPSAGETSLAETIDGPPVVAKYRALQAIENLSADSGRQISAKDRAVKRVNESVAQYVGPVRVDDQHAFIADANAVRALAAFAESNENQRVNRIVRTIANADNTSARQVIEDAESALETAEGDRERDGLDFV